MKKLISLLCAFALLLTLGAFGTAQPATAANDWSREGYFADEDGNIVSVTWMDLDYEAGWYVACMIGEDSWGNMLPQEGDTLHGNIVPDYEEGEMIVTVSEEGEDGLLFEIEGGESFHLTPLDLAAAFGVDDEDVISVTVDVEGLGHYNYAQGEEAEFDDYPYTWTQLNLVEPGTYVFAAIPEEYEWVFVKWTKDGEDYSTDPVIRLDLTESASFTAVYDFVIDGQNPVMNFIGRYVSGRANALVEAEGDDGAFVTIEWGGSAKEMARRVMSGSFDEDTLTMEYADCVKTIVTSGEGGVVEKEVTEYENGTGRIVFDGFGNFSWQGDQSEIEDLEFEWAWVPDGIDYLVLVNKLNPLPDDWEDMLETVHITNSVGDDVEVEVNAYNAYLGLKADLEENDGIFLELDSARRSVAEQQDLMDRFIEKYGADYAAKTVAQPGYSEHHTGLALDLYFRLKGEDGEFTDVYYNEDLIQYPEIWEKIHAKLAEYGFILRYLDGREHLTGYSYEPWHIRYVDDPGIAEWIMSEDITLEEFLGAVNAAEVTIDLGSSELYTEEELQDAVVQIKCQFAAFEGCELHSIRYAGDESCTAENIAWMNELDPNGGYTQVAEFLSDFHSPVYADGTAWNEDEEYTDWQWWLGRYEDGGWELLTWGY